MNSRFWTILNSNLFIFFLSIFFVTIFGTYLADYLQRESWEYQTQSEAERRAYEWDRDKKFKLLQYRLDEGVRSLEIISEAMNQRHFRLQQVYYSLVRNRKVPEKTWENYRDTVAVWTEKLNLFETVLGRLIGKDFQYELNNYESDAYPKNGCPENPPSIHAKFWCSNSILNSLKACETCTERPALKKTLAKLIIDLDYQIDAFVLNAGHEFIKRSSELEEFSMKPK